MRVSGLFALVSPEGIEPSYSYGAQHLKLLCIPNSTTVTYRVREPQKRSLDDGTDGGIRTLTTHCF